MRRAGSGRGRGQLALWLAAIALGVSAAHAGEPGALEETASAPLCCGVPPRAEVTAHAVFGRWVVSGGIVGAPLRRGERVEFRRDGTLATARGPCRFAILRAELTVSCADKELSGEVRFVDDTKLIWRLEGKQMMLIAPAD